MTRKTLLIPFLLSLFLLAPLVRGQGSISLSALIALTNRVETEKSLVTIVDSFGTLFNTGLNAPTAGKIFSIGLDVNMVFWGNSGWVTNVKVSGVQVPGVPVPTIYVGGRIPKLGINLYARGLYIPLSAFKIGTNNPFVLGFGAGWDRDFLGIFNFKALASYHMARGFIFFDVDSVSVTAFATFTRIPLVKPYVFLGGENTWFRVPQLIPVWDTSAFSMVRANATAGVGVNLLKIINVEAVFLPKLGASLGLGYAF